MAYRIIDFHAHAFPEKVAPKAVQFLADYYEVELQGSGILEDATSSAKEAGVEKLVIHATATRPDQVQNVNRWMAAHINKDLIGFGSLHPQYEYLDDEIEFMIGAGLRGIKLHPDFQQVAINDPGMYGIYERLEGRLPLLIHTGDYRTKYSSPSLLKKVLSDFPKLQVVAAHLGGWSEWEESRKVLCGLPNLYFDTSSTLPFLENKKIMDIIQNHGVERILFGTDYPLVHHKEEIEHFMELPLTDEERKLIFYENACRFLNLQEEDL